MTLEELGRRFDRTASWVCRRLALVQELPDVAQEHVRTGRLSAHTAMKVLIPLARANKRDCLQFMEALLKAKCSTRQAEILHGGWTRGDAQVRARLLANPALFLRAREAAQVQDPADKSDLSLLFDDLGALGAAARRASTRIQEGAMQALQAQEALEAARAFRQIQSDCQALFALSGQEPTDA
jgi:hypothetical protein